MNNIVITIGREYGSGGKYIGEQVAKKLKINCYDKEIINKTYEKNNCNYSKLEEYDEVKKSSIRKALDLLSITSDEMIYDNDMYQLLINKTIEEIVDSESCVIIGRNSNKVLKNRPNAINIFIYSNDLEFKIKRKMEIENLSYDEAFKKLKKVDKNRKQYYEYLNKNCIWGNRREYDFCLDSSVLGVEKTADLIVDIYNKLSKKDT